MILIKRIVNYITHTSFFLNRIAYYIASIAAFVYIVSYFFPPLFVIGHIILVMLGVALLLDLVLLYGRSKGIKANRVTADRFSNGDLNRVILRIQNQYSFPVTLNIIDELPIQFQERNWLRKIKTEADKEESIEYHLRPVERGEYAFGDINIYTCSPLQLVKRRYTIPAEKIIKVYPSYVQVRKYQLLAASNRLQETGTKRVRRLGQSMEFEQIKEYVRGDDYRKINWKATARKTDLMINNFTDERSQQVYCLINKGRVMKMPFEGMTLLDHAINASLVLCNVALLKHDKAGLITFGGNQDSFLPADKKPIQMNLLQETLYNQQTYFLEPDFEKLYAVIRNKITHRSLLVLFTNFESLESLEREMNSLRRMAKYHLLLVVFFENTELKQLTESTVSTIEDIYIKTIAEKFAYEKRLMVKELHKNGIASILTTPGNLTVNTINKYLELKTRMSI